MCFTASTALSVSASNALTPSWLVPVGAGQASSRCGAPRLGGARHGLEHPLRLDRLDRLDPEHASLGLLP
jgi:hypothetical protein